MAAPPSNHLSIPSPWQSAFRRWISFHRLLWALTLVSFLIAWNRGLALLYGLFSLLIALLLISYLMPHRQLRNIKVTRRITGDLTAGRPGSITYRLETPRTRYHVELVESLEFSEEEKQHFFLNKISGRTTCTLQFNCRQRGCFQLQDILLSSAYPFGIIKISKHIETELVEILVFPKLFELNRIPMPLLADATTWGEVFIPQKGGRDEYTAVREYSHGDELNRIHWPVSARHQRLVVREYEKTDRPAMLVVLDCGKQFNVGRNHQSTFEYAVSIAASMIRFASREGLQCFLVAHNDRWRELSIQAYSSDLYALYELLARLNAGSRYPYTSLVVQAHQRFPQANLIATFRLDSDPNPPDLSPNVTQIDLEMNARSFRFPDQPGDGHGWRREANRLIYNIAANQNLENLFQ